eukprot:UN32906
MNWKVGIKVEIVDDDGIWVVGKIVSMEEDEGETWLQVETSFKDQLEVALLDELVRPHVERFPMNATYEEFRAKYKVLKKIGRGSYSTVRLIQRKSDKKRFACKQLAKGQLELEDFIQISNEVTFLQRAKHTNIVKFEEYLSTKRSLFIVMEYCEGGHLFDQIVAKKKFSELEARKVLVQIIHGLKYMHDRKLVHRDIKPLNLMLMSKDWDDLRIKLIDFGFLGELKKNKDETLKTVMGSPNYLAPEIVQNKPYTEKVDIWALGVVMFQLLTGGEPPFISSKGSVKEVMKKIVNQKLEIPKHIKKDISEKAVDALNLLLQKDPAKRPSCDEVLKHIWFRNPAAANKTNFPIMHTKNFRYNHLRQSITRGINTILALHRFVQVAGMEMKQDGSKVVLVNRASVCSVQSAGSETSMKVKL